MGFLNAYEKTGERKYLQAAESQWAYIRDHIADSRAGSEWYWSVSEDGMPNASQPIVSQWKCPYHNGRMAFEVIERSKHENLSAD